MDKHKEAIVANANFPFSVLLLSISFLCFFSVILFCKLCVKAECQGDYVAICLRRNK